MGYQPALDGLRALRVIAVILYHANLAWLPGGFIGVEVFFVVSGYLITALLIGERVSTGKISLQQFWLRRARRLLPALGTMLLATAIAVAFVKPEFAPAFRRDIAAAMLYFSNWWQIFFVTVPYFAPVDPPILRHLWSLSIEEQWYLIWPIVFGVVLNRKKMRLHISGVVVVMLAFAIMAGTAVMYLADDETRTNFLYLSTLTRSTGLLCGAGLAFFWRPFSAKPFNAVARVVAEGASVAAIFTLGLVAAVISVDDARLYRGGLAAATIASCLLISVVVHPTPTFFKRVFSIPLIVEIGRRSYGLYLWHWPIFVLFGARDSVDSLAVALAVTVAVNEISYTFIEQPARRGALGKLWRNRAQLTVMRRLPAIAATLVVTAAIALSSVRISGIQAIDLSIDTGNHDIAFVVPTTVATATTISSATTTTIAKLPRKLVIVGDSQAHALAVNKPPGIEKTFTISDGSIDGCGVYDSGVGVGGSNGKFRRSFVHCVGFEKRWASSATKAKADVALVVIGAWEVFDVQVNGFTFKLGTGPADTFFTTQITRGIAALRKTGATVALLEVACMRPIDSAGGPVPALPQRADDARTGHLNDLMRTIAAHYGDGVYFISGPKQWCTDKSISSSTAYRWDGVHVYRPGAKLIFETIARAILQLPVGPK